MDHDVGVLGNPKRLGAMMSKAPDKKLQCKLFWDEERWNWSDGGGIKNAFDSEIVHLWGRGIFVVASWRVVVTGGSGGSVYWPIERLSVSFLLFLCCPLPLPFDVIDFLY